MLSFVKLNDSLHLYINGARVAAYSTYTLYALGTTSFTTYGAVGVSTGGNPNTQYFNGKIYWLNIYNVGMSPAQISAIYSAVDTTFYGLGGRMRADSLMTIGRIPVIDSIAPDTVASGDTVTISGSDWLQQKDAGWVRMDSATSQLDLDTASWDSTQIKAIIKSVDEGAHSIQVFNSDSFGDTVSVFYNSAPPAPPGPLSYSPSSWRDTVGSADLGHDITNSGGAVDSFRISPALPAGLTLDSTTGAISGTPTARSASTLYVTTGYNAAGTATAACTISVTGISILAVSPATGDTAGLDTVTITGTMFGASKTGSAAVTIDGDAPSEYVSWSDTLVVVIIPAHAAGAVDIAITNASGAGGGTATAAGAYMYYVPVSGGARRGMGMGMGF
jgi:hypothetical protein